MKNGGISGSYMSLWIKGRTLMSFYKCKSVSPKDFIHVIILRHTEEKKTKQTNESLLILASIHGARSRNYIKQSVEA